MCCRAEECECQNEIEKSSKKIELDSILFEQQFFGTQIPFSVFLNDSLKITTIEPDDYILTTFKTFRIGEMRYRIMTGVDTVYRINKISNSGFRSV